MGYADDEGYDWWDEDFEEQYKARESFNKGERFLWQTKNGDVLPMEGMTTSHLTNCLRFANAQKTREINEVLAKRTKEENNMVPDRNPDYGKAPDDPLRKKLFGDK